MKYLNAIRLGFTNALDFKGRTSRTEFWIFFLFWLLVLYVANTIDGFVIAPMYDFLPGEEGGPKWLSISVTALFLVPLISAAVRRLHDIGWTGFLLLLLVPITVFVILVSFPDLLYMQTFSFLISPFTMLWFSNGWIALLLPFILLMWKGQKGENRYGE